MKLYLGLRQCALIGVVIITPLIMQAWMFAPRRKANAAMHAQIKRKSAVLSRLDRYRGKAGEQLGRQTRDLREAMESMRAHLPLEGETSTMLRRLSLLADEHALRTYKIQTLHQVGRGAPAARNDADAYDEHTIRVELQGTFDNLYRFLLALEREEQMVRIKSMKLAGESGATPSGSLHTALDLGIVYRRELDGDDTGKD